MASRAGSSKKPILSEPTVQKELKEGGKPENPSPEISDDMVNQLIAKMLARDSLSLRVAPSLPAPEKFTMGGNYPRWELQAQAYVRKFPLEEQKVAILGLLSGEAADRVHQSNALEGSNLTDVFAKVRGLLDMPLHPVEYQAEFYAACQRVGETIETYGYRLKQLVIKAFPEDTQEHLDQRAKERFTQGVASPAVKKTLLKRRSTNFNEAVLLAVETEKIQRAVQSGDDRCVMIGHQQPQRTQWAHDHNRQPFQGQFFQRNKERYTRRWNDRRETPNPPRNTEDRVTSTPSSYPSERPVQIPFTSITWRSLLVPSSLPTIMQYSLVNVSEANRRILVPSVWIVENFVCKLPADWKSMSTTELCRSPLSDDKCIM